MMMAPPSAYGADAPRHETAHRLMSPRPPPARAADGQKQGPDPTETDQEEPHAMTTATPLRGTACAVHRALFSGPIRLAIIAPAGTLAMVELDAAGARRLARDLERAADHAQQPVAEVSA